MNGLLTMVDEAAERGISRNRSAALIDITSKPMSQKSRKLEGTPLEWVARLKGLPSPTVVLVHDHHVTMLARAVSLIVHVGDAGTSKPSVDLHQFFSV